jgi:NADPH:quinone reductase
MSDCQAAAGRLHPVIGQEFGLSAAAGVHEAIGSRTTIGKTLLALPRRRPVRRGPGGG